MTEVLKVICELMKSLQLNYEFGRMSKSPPEYPYWVGDYTESEPYTEDGEENATIILTGFARGQYITLEKQKEIIKDFFKYGVKQVTENGTSISISTSNIINIPIDDIDLKKCQINLSVKFWKGS